MRRGIQWLRAVLHGGSNGASDSSVLWQRIRAPAGTAVQRRDADKGCDQCVGALNGRLYGPVCPLPGVGFQVFAQLTLLLIITNVQGRPIRNWHRFENAGL